MKLFKIFVGAVVAATAVVAINSANASATSVPLCTVKPVGLADWQKSFKFNGDNVTATFTLEGASNCKYDMTVAAFSSKSVDLQPVKDQTLYSFASGRFGKGTHTLTTKIPECQFQLDIFTGKPLNVGNSDKGTRYHDFVNTGNFVNLDQWHTDGNTARLIDFYENKTKCADEPKEEPKEDPKDVCPNIDGDQAEIPEGHEIDGKGNCVVPEEPETPEEKPQVKSESTPSVLPNTGGGAVAATFAGITASTGAAHSIVTRLKHRK